MNVIVVPDAAMIVIPLIEKNGHTYLSPSNFSKYDNTEICDGNFSPSNLMNSYSSSEIPSGVKGRLFLFATIVDKADAAIIIGKRPKNRIKMYNALNDLILFGGNSCNNFHSLTLKIVQDLNIPTLKLAYPTNRNQIIDLINQTNDFLKNLDSSSQSVNDDNLNIDGFVNQDKCSVFDVNRILNKLI